MRKRSQCSAGKSKKATQHFSPGGHFGFAAGDAGWGGGAAGRGGAAEAAGCGAALERLSKGHRPPSSIFKATFAGAQNVESAYKQNTLGDGKCRPSFTRSEKPRLASWGFRRKALGLGAGEDFPSD